MTTPVYSNVSAAFPAVSYYTQFDPYFYTVDNRPLYNLASVDSVLGTGVDAAARATLIDALSAAASYKNLYGASPFITGLELTNPAANVVRVDIGALYAPLAISSSDTRVVIKQGVHAVTTDFSIPPPAIVGQSVTYLIQGLYVDFGASTSSTFPFFDATNTVLPNTLFNGELQLQIVTGVAATTGTQTTPAPTVGWTPLYVLTVDYGATSYYNAAYATNAPASKCFPRTGIPLSNLTSTSASIGDTPVTAFADAATQGAIGRVQIHPSASLVNPYKPVRVKVDYVPSVTGNAFAVRLKYQVLDVSTLLTPVSYTVGAIENITVTAAANSIASYTFTASVPGYLVNGKNTINLVMERVGADASDTNTGILNVMNFTVYQ
jgi:hypothetical protein